MSVWISDEKLLILASLISPSKMILFEKKYQKFDTVFYHQMKHLEVRQKYSAARRFFNSLLGVSNTASHVWYIKRKSMFSFTSAKKREIRHFHVVVVRRQQRNVQKSVMHLQSCWFANLLLLFCRSRCRCRRCRRRRSLSSLFFWRKYAILHQRHSTTVSSSVNTLQILSELSRVLLDR